jgi:hypothetical protein
MNRVKKRLAGSPRKVRKSHLGYFSRKSEADIVFKLRPKCERSFEETKRIREHQDRLIAERLTERNNCVLVIV